MAPVGEDGLVDDDRDAGSSGRTFHRADQLDQGVELQARPFGDGLAFCLGGGGHAGGLVFDGGLELGEVFGVGGDVEVAHAFAVGPHRESRSGSLLVEAGHALVGSGVVDEGSELAVEGVDWEPAGGGRSR